MSDMIFCGRCCVAYEGACPLHASVTDWCSRAEKAEAALDLVRSAEKLETERLAAWNQIEATADIVDPGHLLRVNEELRQGMVLLRNQVPGLTASLDEYRHRAEAAEKAFLACAQAIGISYEAEGHNSAPGPLEVVVEQIDRARRAVGQVAEFERLLAQEEEVRVVAERRAAALVTYARHLANCWLYSMAGPRIDDERCTCGLAALLGGG